MTSGMTQSEDEIGCLNEEMFMVFVHPHLAALSARFNTRLL